MTFPYRFCHLGLRFLAPLLMREREVRGLENVPLCGPVIFVANHTCYWDPIVLLAFVPRQIFFMSKAEMFRYPFVGWLFRRLEVFGVERGSPDLHSIRHAVEILNRGDPVGVYPQGTRAPLPEGQTHPAKGGVLAIAKRSGAPLIPVAVSGLETLFLRRFPWLGRPAVRVTFGPPFRIEDLQAPAGRENREAVLEALMERITKLLPEQSRPGGQE